MSSLMKKAGATVKKIGGMRDEMLRNIWLAGLGAYAKSAEEVEQLSARSQSLFDELIARGKQVEESTRERVAHAAEHGSELVEGRVQRLMQKAAGMDSGKLEQLNDKLDNLSRQVESLLKAKGMAPLDEPAAAPLPKVTGRPAAKPKAEAKAVAAPVARPAAKAVARPAAKAAPKAEPQAELKAELSAAAKPAAKALAKVVEAMAEGVKAEHAKAKQAATKSAKAVKPAAKQAVAKVEAAASEVAEQVETAVAELS
ncbi:MAG: phasin family protein [Gammaproteobacteria bacterium]|nr:phasin family protein [Gammaproteobacteria bacterium]